MLAALFVSFWTDAFTKLFSMSEIYKLLLIKKWGQNLQSSKSSTGFLSKKKVDSCDCEQKPVSSVFDKILKNLATTKKVSTSSPLNHSFCIGPSPLCSINPKDSLFFLLSFYFSTLFWPLPDPVFFFPQKSECSAHLRECNSKYMLFSGFKMRHQNFSGLFVFTTEWKT